MKASKFTEAQKASIRKYETRHREACGGIAFLRVVPPIDPGNSDKDVESYLVTIMSLVDVLTGLSEHERMGSAGRSKGHQVLHDGHRHIGLLER